MARKKVNQATVDLIKSFEGLHRKGSDGMIHVYPDAGYGWRWATQGYGTTTNPDTGKRLKRGDPPIDRETAERWLQADIESKYAPKVATLVKVPLSPDSFGALVSFAYNVGTGALARSTLLKRVNAKRFDEVPAQFMRWNKSNGRVFRGLTRRRKAEARMFMAGLDGPSRPAVPPLPTRKPVDAGFARTITRWFLDWWR